MLNYTKYKKIDLFDLNYTINRKSEMSTEQLSFLLGLIKKYRPQKIVEVGVSAGGTSVEILRGINKMELPCVMYSIDLDNQYYRDRTKSCGYLIEEMDNSARQFHTLLTGKMLPQCLDKIGKDIDFLILDTMHILPGEILDFLAALPYLKKNAIVVLHDTSLHHFGSRNSIATSVLFQVVTAEKFLNNDMCLPNIAAFMITEDTNKYIMDVFYALSLPWEYVLDRKQLLIYDNMYSKWYGEEAIRLWEQAKVMGIQSFNEEKEKVKFLLDCIEKMKENAILLYGIGNYAKKIRDILFKCGIQVSGFIISDDQNEQEPYEGIPVYYFSEIPEKYSNALIIMSINSKRVENILSESEYEYIALPYLLFEILKLS